MWLWLKVASDSDSLFKKYMVGSKVFFLLIMLWRDFSRYRCFYCLGIKFQPTRSTLVFSCLCQSQNNSSARHQITMNFSHKLLAELAVEQRINCVGLEYQIILQFWSRQLNRGTLVVGIATGVIPRNDWAHLFCKMSWGQEKIAVDTLDTKLTTKPQSEIEKTFLNWTTKASFFSDLCYW